MLVSRPAVHPVDVPSLTDVAANPPRMEMNDIQGMPGAHSGLALRISQFIFAAASLAFMVSASDFSSVTAFCYLVAAVILQCMLCATCQTQLAESSNCLFLYHWGWDGVRNVAQSNMGLPQLLRLQAAACADR